MNFGIEQRGRCIGNVFSLNLKEFTLCGSLILLCKSADCLSVGMVSRNTPNTNCANFTQHCDTRLQVC